MHCVITTIAPPTKSVLQFASKLAGYNAKIIIVGDSKGPNQYPLENVPADFLSLSDQQKGPFRLGSLLPVAHYSRKNIGYLYAVADGASCIYETDDDNAPNSNWTIRSRVIDQTRIVSFPTAGFRWINVYKYFSNELVWPRGLPLEEILKNVPETTISDKLITSPLQQGLVNGAPDVDAIWRLALDRNFNFDNKISVVLQPGNWCPFNTQSTWWWPEVFPLLYIPSYCSFRMCDIWKSFIAQRCLWELDYGVVFHAPEVIQDRNYHRLIKDFEDEIPGYLGNQKIAEILNALSLKKGRNQVADNLVRCYEALNKAGFFPNDELLLVKTWLNDIEPFI